MVSGINSWCLACISSHGNWIFLRTSIHGKEKIWTWKSIRVSNWKVRKTDIIKYISIIAIYIKLATINLVCDSEQEWKTHFGNRYYYTKILLNCIRNCYTWPIYNYYGFVHWKTIFSITTGELLFVVCVPFLVIRPFAANQNRTFLLYVVF